MAAWTLDEGLELVRLLQPATRQFSYHLCLGGGVLNTGRSEKDLDLYFLPLAGHDHKAPDPKGLVAWLEGLWGTPEPIGGNYEMPVGNGDAAYKARLKYVYSGEWRIDVFVV